MHRGRLNININNLGPAAIRITRPQRSKGRTAVRINIGRPTGRIELGVLDDYAIDQLPLIPLSGLGTCRC